jgi:hypothetical protein
LARRPGGEGVHGMAQLKGLGGFGANPRGVGALIAVLVRYPEVSSLELDAHQGVLALSFCCRGAVSAEQFAALHEAWNESMLTYRDCLRLPDPRLATLDLDVVEAVSTVILTRDVESLTVEEVGLTIEILREQVGSELVADPADLVEEEWMAQEETIQATLETLRDTPGGRLFALREEGRVLVFNS